MSTSGSDVGPTSPLPAWQPAAAGTRTRVQDRISLIESAGSSEACNSAASDFRFSRPQRHLRTCSAGDFNQEQEEEAVPGFEGTMGSRTEMKQELNRRLQMKADELERIFAEHKRRVATKPVVESSGMNRGRMYERYMEKRDAKRREERGRSREEEAAKRRAMWESVERSKAELEQWYKRHEHDPTTKKEDDVYGTLTQFFDLDLDSRIKNILISNSSCSQFWQQNLSSVLAEDEEDDAQSSDGSLKSVNSKMHRSRTMSSSTSSKPPTSRFSRSSAPISDFRKENAKPSTVISKSNTHTQPIGVPRSKSTSAGASFFKEEKPPRSASLRKSSVAPLTPQRTTCKEQSVSKPFLKKGKGIGSDAGSGLSKLRTSMSSSLNEASVDVVDASSLDSPTGSITSSLYSQDGTRVRKKWGTAQIPFLAPDSSLKKFLHFGKKSTVGDRASILAVSGADYDTEVGRDQVSEQTRGLRLGFPLHACDGFSFSEGMNLHEQQEVQTPRRSIRTPTNFNVRKDHLSENLPKSPRSFFSLSAFRNKGVESRLR